MFDGRPENNPNIPFDETGNPIGALTECTANKASRCLLRTQEEPERTIIIETLERQIESHSEIFWHYPTDTILYLLIRKCIVYISYSRPEDQRMYQYVFHTLEKYMEYRKNLGGNYDVFEGYFRVVDSIFYAFEHGINQELKERIEPEDRIFKGSNREFCEKIQRFFL